MDELTNLRDQLRAADQRIAELESRIRQNETTERERSRMLREMIEKLNAELTTNRATIAASAQAAETACGKLLQYQPVVKAARAVVQAWHDKNDAAGDRAARSLHDSVLLLPPEAS